MNCPCRSLKRCSICSRRSSISFLHALWAAVFSSVDWIRKCAGKSWRREPLEQSRDGLVEGHCAVPILTWFAYRKGLTIRTPSMTRSILKVLGEHDLASRDLGRMDD